MLDKDEQTWDSSASWMSSFLLWTAGLPPAPRAVRRVKGDNGRRELARFLVPDGFGHCVNFNQNISLVDLEDLCVFLKDWVGPVRGGSEEEMVWEGALRPQPCSLPVRLPQALFLCED